MSTELEVYVKRLRATEFRASGYAVIIVAEPDTKIYRYTIGEEGGRELIFDESANDTAHLSRLLAACMVHGCELGISKPAEKALLLALSRPIPVTVTPTPAKPRKRARKANK